jgi:transposase
MTSIRIGLDIAKNVFQAHGVDDKGTVVVLKRLRRPDLLPFFASLPPCLIGIEACSASHHWARELIGLGHEVRLMPARYVKPYVQRGKSDALTRRHRSGDLRRPANTLSHRRVPQLAPSYCQESAKTRRWS